MEREHEQPSDQRMGGGSQPSTQHPDYQSGQIYEQQQRQRQLRDDQGEEVVQVVYQSDQNGALMDVESTSLLGAYNAQLPPSPGEGPAAGQRLAYIDSSSSALAEPAQLDGGPGAQLPAGAGHQQLSRAASTLPSVAEESTSSGPNGVEALGDGGGGAYALEGPLLEGPASLANGDARQPLVAPDGQQYGAPDYLQNNSQEAVTPTQAEPQLAADFQYPIYSTVNKHPLPNEAPLYPLPEGIGGESEAYPALEDNTYTEHLSDYKENLGDDLVNYEERDNTNEDEPAGALLEEPAEINQELGQIIARQRAGAVERGSFRHNFRKKLGLSVSTNENDLTAHRQKFIEQVQDEDRPLEDESGVSGGGGGGGGAPQQSASLLGGQKFKRTHSVSFNVNASRGNRHSVDIRNLPSYLTHKRASIVDVAKGAMTSLISSLGGGGGGGGTGSSLSSVLSSGLRRDSTNYDSEFEDNEPIFEEPIAPTLSLGQRVAMVRNSGTEFGTVGWIGQLADIDDDWIVGVIFDNMIGDCDGAYKGARYFYARDGYAMFVPLSVLTKTDNYIGRPETGTVLSRMSVSLRPGQLISIQRSSIRLQHCFLNAPHQRVGHDVRAVSNRLHCQCHNCGPCAHLTKQGRPNVLPHFGAHHLPVKKKNSLAHAAVEMLAHHHHHFHEEEEHDEKDYEFGDNSAHACNFVRYSCCQQSGQPGHEFSSDCGMVRPELLDNLIHAPKAPHRRARPKRKSQQQRQRLRGGDRTYRRAQQPAGNPEHQLGAQQQQQPHAGRALEPAAPAFTADTMNATNTLETNPSGTMKSSNYATSELASEETGDDGQRAARGKRRGSQSSYLSSRSQSSSRSASTGASSRSVSPANAPPQEPYNYYQYDTSSFRPQNNVYRTVESQVSIVDQQRFVFRRDSSAFAQSPGALSNWSDDLDSARTSTSGLGARLMRCLGCLRRRAPTARRPRRRKLSFKDKMLEYRRRQSTFVPSTLAKPHEDFASHGIVLHGQQPLAPPRSGSNSDYSSCSKSSRSSSRSSSSSSSSSCSSSPYRPPDPDGGPLAAGQQHAAASLTLEAYGAAGQGEQQRQLKSSGQWASYMVAEAEADYRRQLDYGDYNFSEGYGGTQLKHDELSKDSALADLAHSDAATYKTDSSSDTLKFLVDRSINEQVPPPPPPMQGQQVDMSPDVSPAFGRPAGETASGSTTSEQVDISSPTASAIDHEPEEEDDDEDGEAGGQAAVRANFGNLHL